VIRHNQFPRLTQPFRPRTVVPALALVAVLAVTACAAGRPSVTGGGATVGGAPTAAASQASAAPAPPAPAAPAAVPAAPTAVPPTATPQPLPAPAPNGLQQVTADGKLLPAADWTAGTVILQVPAPATGADLVPQVEVEPAAQPFTGTVTAQAAGVTGATPGGTVQVAVSNLTPGLYHWEARFQDPQTHLAGPWEPYDGGAAAFGVAGPAPAITNLSVSGASQTANGVAMVGKTDQAALTWSAAANPSQALDHLAFLADQQSAAPATPPAGAVALAADATSQPLTNLTDGQWYLHLWAVDKAGQVSAPQTVAVSIQRTPPAISNVIYRSWATNPAYQSVPIKFTISRPANVQVTIMPSGSTDALRTYQLGAQPGSQEIDLSWDGKDSQGKAVAPGNYRFLITAADTAGNQSQAMYDGLSITDKVIQVFLSKQLLVASAGGKVYLSTIVTTGGQELPTPPGTYEVLSKQHPFVFHSPYPKGSPFWYADVTSNYAMLFNQSGADFLHDAPWRHVFGPGTDGPGIPGGTYSGSHGCVEIPEAVMAGFFGWTPLGTPVIVTP
jgi:lipoprotein-anchoring transpeptidase ErfK/SrfK